MANTRNLIHNFLENSYINDEFLNTMGLGTKLIDATPSIDAILRNQELALEIWGLILVEKKSRYVTIAALQNALLYMNNNRGADKLKFCYELMMNIHH